MHCPQVLSAACRNAVESLEMRLTMRTVPGGAPGTETQQKPFLSLVTTGSTISMAQDLPITKPHPSSRESSDLVSLLPAFFTHRCWNSTEGGRVLAALGWSITKPHPPLREFAAAMCWS